MNASSTLENSQISPSVPSVDLYTGDCRQVLTNIEDESVHMVLTDPPYFLDGLDDRWKKGHVIPRSSGTVGGLPVGMKFDPEQGRKLQEFLTPVCKNLLRVLVPGGFLLMFSSPRLYHRMALSAEETGFEIRDQYIWRFTKSAQFKAFSLDHFVARKSELSVSEQESVLQDLAGRKTPQLRPQFESILCAQKPRHGTFVDNWSKYRTGLIDPRQSLDGNSPSTVMHVEKSEKQPFNKHLTPKPVQLCEHLIRLFTMKGQIVLDPFVGSGTTCIAAYAAERACLGIDINDEYVQIAKRRLLELDRKKVID